MAVDLLGGSTATSQTSTLKTPTLGQAEFLKILLTQLQFQDPLKPLDNEQFLAQMAQFSTLAQTSQVNDNISSLLTLQAATQSIGLIGKTVQVNTTNGSSIGTVSSLAFNNGTPSLTITATDGSVLTGVSVSQLSVVK